MDSKMILLKIISLKNSHVTHDLKHCFFVRFGHGAQRHTKVILTESHCSHCSLYRNRVYFAEQGADQREQFTLDFSSSCNIAGEVSVAHLHGAAGSHIGDHGDHAASAHGQDGKNTYPADHL